MLDWLKGVADTQAFARAYAQLLIERGPLILLGMFIIVVGVVMFVAGNSAVQNAAKSAAGAATAVATRGASAAGKVGAVASKVVK